MSKTLNNTLPFKRGGVGSDVENIWCKKIASLGYDDPWNDTDSRQKRMFREDIRELVDEGGWTCGLETSSDASEIAIPANKSLFGVKQAEVYKHTQTRASREGDEQNLRDYLYEFYVRGDRLEKIPVALRIPGLGDFPGSGCLRSKVHYTAIYLGHSGLGLEPVGVDESRFDYFWIQAPEGMSQNEAVDIFTTRISSRSNDDSVSKVRAKNKADRAIELERAWERACSLPHHWASLSASFEDKKKYAIEEHFPNISYYPEPSVAGDIINDAFAGHRGQPIDHLSDAELSQVFSQFFPRRKWVEGSSKSRYTYKKVSASRLLTMDGVVKVQQPENWTYDNIQDAKLAAKEVYAVITQPSKVTSHNTVLENIKSCLEAIKEYNVHPMREEQGYPLYRGLLFLKHLDLPTDVHQAYEFSDDERFEDV